MVLGCDSICMSDFHHVYTCCRFYDCPRSIVHYLDYRRRLKSLWRSVQGSGLRKAPKSPCATSGPGTAHFRVNHYHHRRTMPFPNAQLRDCKAGSSKHLQSTSLGKKRKYQHFSDVFDDNNIAERYTEDKGKKTTKKGQAKRGPERFKGPG